MNGFIQQRARDLGTPLTLSAMLCALVVAAPGSLANRVDLMLLSVTIVVGFYLFAGLSGVLSFGHMSFVAIGAYLGAYLTIPPALKVILLPGLPSSIQSAQVSVYVAALLAGLVTAAFAVVISVPLMRLPGLSLSLAMFALLVIVYQVASQWDSVTRGRQSIYGIPVSIETPQALGVAVLAILIAGLHQRSRSGLRLRALREDDVAASALGIARAGERRKAFVLSAFILGSAGAVYGSYHGVFGPKSFYLDLTFLTIAMLVIGGRKSLSGAVLGPVFVSMLTYALSTVEDGIRLGSVAIPARPGVQQVGLALVMLLVLLVRADGLTGGREMNVRALIARLPGRRHPASSTPERTQLGA